MSRVIKTESAGKDRNRLVRSVVLSIRELMQQPEPNETARDSAAFIVIALAEIFNTVDESVQAWEKRGYWVKADRFRMDWEWTGRMSESLRQALMKEDWALVAATTAQVAQRLGNVTIPERNRLGRPWEGAWKKLRSS